MRTDWLASGGGRTDHARSDAFGDRAQSEALGFALIVAVVVLILGLVLTVGYANLADARDHERVNNAERGMEAFAANVDAVVRDDAPSRSTELSVADGRLVTREETTLTVEWTAASGGTTRSKTVPLRSLAYDGGDGRVVYEGGAVFREDDGGAALVRPPSFEVSSSHVIVPIVQLDGRERVGVSGEDAVLLRTARDRGASDVLVATGQPHDVTVEVSGPRAAAWQRYFESRTDATCSLSGDTATCSLRTDRLTVVYVVIAVEEAA